jgi:hypothetical protein
MAINHPWWAAVSTPGGSGGSSHSVSLRFGSPRNITAQAAIGGLGGAPPVGEIGFSAYVQDGAYHTLGSDVYGTWAHVFFGNRVTQLDVSARSYDAWVSGSAIVYSWDEGVEGV